MRILNLSWNNEQLLFEKPLIYSYNFTNMWKSILAVFVFFLGGVLLIGKAAEVQVGDFMFVTINTMWCYFIVTSAGFMEWNFQYKFREDKSEGGYLISFYKNYGKFDANQEKELRFYALFSFSLFIILSVIILYTSYCYLYKIQDKNLVALSICCALIMMSSVHFLCKIYYFETRYEFYDYLIWNRLDSLFRLLNKVYSNAFLKSIINATRWIIVITLLIYMLQGLFYLLLLGSRVWTEETYTINDFWLSSKIYEYSGIIYYSILGFLGITHDKLMFFLAVLIIFSSAVYFVIMTMHFFLFSLNTKQSLLEISFQPLSEVQNEQEAIIPSIEPFYQPTNERERMSPRKINRLKQLRWEIASELLKTGKLNDDEIIKICLVSKQDLKEIKQEITAANNA